MYSVRATVRLFPHHNVNIALIKVLLRADSASSLLGAPISPNQSFIMPNNLVLPKVGSKSSSRASSKASRVRPPPTLPYAPAIATLFLGKASRVFAAFVSYHYLQDRVALPLYLFFVTFGAAATLLSLQRPWNGKRIGQKRTRRVLIAGAILALTLYIWTAGLRSAGPLRTLLVDGAELPLLYLFAVVSRRELPEKRKSRGAFCMLLAYALLIWDASGHVPDVAEIERSRLGQRAEHTIGKIANKTSAEIESIRHLGANAANSNGDTHPHVGGSRRRLLTTYQPPVKGSGRLRDAFVEGTALRSEIGVILVLAASVIMQSSRAFNRRLATELGGAKRHFALSTSCAWAWMTPLALLSYVSSSTGAVLSLSIVGGIKPMTMNIGHVVGFAMVGFLWLVLPYYVRAIVSTTIPQRTMLQSGVVVPFLMACVGSVVVGESGSGGGVSWILVIAFVLECAGVTMMMAGGVRRGLSELPIDGSGTIGSRTDVGGEDESANSAATDR